MLHSKELRNYTNSQPHSEGSNSNSERAGPLLRSPTRTLLRVPRAAFTANKPIKRAMKHCNRCGLHAFASPTPPFWLQALMNSGAVASGVARGFFLPIVFISFLPCFFTSYYVFFFFLIFYLFFFFRSFLVLHSQEPFSQSPKTTCHGPQKGRILTFLQVTSGSTYWWKHRAILLSLSVTGAL